MNYVVVVTHGRSGSTLLMGLLNAIPGYCIRGENYNVLTLHETIVNRLMLSKTRHATGSDQPVHAWYGIAEVEREALVTGVRGMMLEQVLRPAPGTRVTGFKEIRYGSRDLRDLTAHLHFVRDVLPGVRLIFNTRSVEATSNSGWWKNDSEARSYLTDFHQRMRAAYDVHRECSIWVEYESITTKTSEVARLFDFLGERFDGDAAAEILKTRHSVRPNMMPGGPLRLSRRIERSPRPVFEALVTADDFPKWWTLPGWCVRRCEIERRNGGNISIELEGGGGRIEEISGTLQELIEGRRFSFTLMLRPPLLSGDFAAFNILTVEPVETGATTVRVEISGVGGQALSQAGADFLRDAWSSSFARLAALSTSAENS